VELQGETLKVLKGLEAVVGHLRKFLVDQSVLPLFEKTVSLIFPILNLAYKLYLC
jgi:poly(rC)-binding protein 2/3/4